MFEITEKFNTLLYKTCKSSKYKNRSFLGDLTIREYEKLADDIQRMPVLEYLCNDD